jgi:hypothetical protein
MGGAARDVRYGPKADITPFGSFALRTRAKIHSSTDPLGKCVCSNDRGNIEIGHREVVARAIDMDLAATPNLEAWLTRCLARPAARKALALRTVADNETPAEVIRRIAKINRL